MNKHGCSVYVLYDSFAALLPPSGDVLWTRTCLDANCSPFPKLACGRHSEAWFRVTGMVRVYCSLSLCALIQIKDRRQPP
jgi:hypothetical protein